MARRAKDADTNQNCNHTITADHCAGQSVQESFIYEACLGNLYGAAPPTTFTQKHGRKSLLIVFNVYMLSESHVSVC